MDNNAESIQLIKSVKELFSKNINNHRELSKLIDKYLVPEEADKKSNAEVSTPFQLRQDMLDKIPTDFWKKPNKIFEPCSGKGGFIIDIIDRFMEGLQHTIPDESIRYRTIVEDCLYFCDINNANIFICKLLINRGNHSEYNLNCLVGNTLTLNIKQTWDVDGFDAVIGNPPYNASGDTGTGNTIWQEFTRRSLQIWLNPGGYLLFVHPPGWRKPNTIRGKFYGMYKLMTKDNQMIYLSIHGIKDGKLTFNCGTRYDFYLIKKEKSHMKTEVNDETGKNVIVDMNEFQWLPNYNIETIQNILATGVDELCNIIQSMSAYEPRKQWMSKTESSEYKYPCIHSTPKSGVRYVYSSRNDRGHFGVPKVIFGDSGIYTPIIDMDGKYGMTHHSMAIEISNMLEATALAEALISDKMMGFLKCCAFSSYAIDWNIFKDLKKNFWRDL